MSVRVGVLGGLVVVLIGLASAALFSERGNGPPSPSATPSSSDLSPTPDFSPASSPTPAFSPIGQSPTAGAALSPTPTSAGTQTPAPAPTQAPTPIAGEEVAITGVPEWIIPTGFLLILLGAVAFWSAIRLPARSR